jgi:hypothetical protein
MDVAKQKKKRRNSFISCLETHVVPSVSSKMFCDEGDGDDWPLLVMTGYIFYFSPKSNRWNSVTLVLHNPDLDISSCLPYLDDDCNITEITKEHASKQAGIFSTKLMIQLHIHKTEIAREQKKNRFAINSKCD